MSMQSSARNQFIGTVFALRNGPVDVEVTIQLSDDTQLISLITKESANRLDIALGQELYALIKSSSIMLVTDDSIKLSSRNQLWGNISKIYRGPINTEVVIDLPSNRNNFV